MTRQSNKRFTGMIAFAIMICFTASTAWGIIRLGKWEEEWGKSKKEYEQITGNKKPKAGRFFRSAGLDKALKNADKAYETAKDRQGRRVRKTTPKTTEDFEKSIDNFKKKVKAFSNAKEKYLDILEKAADEETDPVIKKAMKILRKDLKAIEISMRGQLKIFKTKADEDPTEVDPYVLRERSLNETAILNIQTFKDSLSEMKRGLARLRTKPSVDTWNKVDMNQLLRDMSNALESCETSNLDTPRGLKDQFFKYESESLDTVKSLIKKGMGTEEEVVETALDEIEASVKEASRYLKTLI